MATKMSPERLHASGVSHGSDVVAAGASRAFRLPATLWLRDVARSRTFTEARFYAGLVAVFMLSVAAVLSLVTISAAALPGWTPVLITSDSMSPAIRRGDVVIARAVEGGELTPGAVVVFEDPDGSGLVTHRVVSADPSGTYQTRGDANGKVDSTPLTAGAVRGVGKLLVPFIGLPLIWASNAAWLHIAVALAVAATALWLVRYVLLDEYSAWS